MYWFPAKRHGWGWGVPVCWQGWAVLAVYAVLVAWAVGVFLIHGEHIRFLIVTAALSVLLAAVCWAKGEPPRWRWGGD